MDQRSLRRLPATGTVHTQTWATSMWLSLQSPPVVCHRPFPFPICLCFCLCQDPSACARTEG